MARITRLFKIAKLAHDLEHSLLLCACDVCSAHQFRGAAKLCARSRGRYQGRNFPTPDERTRISVCASAGFNRVVIRP